MLIVGWISAYQQNSVSYCTQRRNGLLLKLSSCPLMEFSRRPSTTTILISALNDTAVTYSPDIATTTAVTATIPKLLGPASGLGFLAASLVGKPHKYLQSLQKRHGENFIIRPNIVVLNDPAAIRDVLETYNLPKTPKVRMGYKSIFYGSNNKRGGGSGSNSGGILAATWNKWLQQRRMAAPALAECVIGSLAPKFHDVSLPLFEYLESMAERRRTAAVDMSAAFTAVTMDAIGTILLGKSFGMCQRLGKGTAVVEVVPFASALHRLTGK